jgi:hypothetical protein
MRQNDILLHASRFTASYNKLIFILSFQISGASGLARTEV